MPLDGPRDHASGSKKSPAPAEPQGGVKQLAAQALPPGLGSILPPHPANSVMSMIGDKTLGGNAIRHKNAGARIFEAGGKFGVACSLKGLRLSSRRSLGRIIVLAKPRNLREDFLQYGIGATGRAARIGFFFPSEREQRAMHHNARPTSVVVLGVFNIIYGAAVGLYSVCGGLMLVAGAAVGTSQTTQSGQQAGPIGFDQYEFIQRRVPSFYIIGAVSTTVWTLIPLILVGAGIGVLRVQGWARTASILCAAALVLATAVDLAYTISLVDPAMADYYAEKAKAPGMAGLAVAANLPLIHAITIFSNIFPVVYPIALLIILNRPRIKAAFVPKALPADVPIREGDHADAAADRADERILPASETDHR